MTLLQAAFYSSRWLCSLAMCGAAAALVGCGGGDSPPAAGTTSTPLTLTGTAATGAAMAGRPVDVKCAPGTGTATTAAAGTYTISVTDGVLPCALRVTAADGTVLYSVASGTGSSAVANINAVTHLVVAALTGADPTTLYTNFTASTASAVTAGSVTAAVTSVVNTLKAAGIDLSAIGNVLTASLVAANGATAGNAYDQGLDALKAAQTSSGTTLAQLTQTVANTTTTAAPASTSFTASLPADLLLKPAATNCAALRSGVYRVVAPKLSVAGSFSTALITVNATTLSITNGTSTWSVTPNGTCRFLGSTGEDIVVSQAGVVLSRDHSSAGDPFRLTMAFPEQSHTVAELEGTWNKLGFQRNAAGTAYGANAATATFNSSGVSTAISFCADVKTCVPVTTETVTLSVNAGGGFNRSYASGNAGDRLFAYRAGGGELMLMDIGGDGGFGLWTRQRTRALPTVGVVFNGWSINVDSQLLVPSPVSTSSNTILTVDSTTGGYTRRASTAVAGVTRPESLMTNTPRNGYTLRNAATNLQNSAGGTETVSEYIALFLPGMGVTPLAVPAVSVFVLSVEQP